MHLRAAAAGRNQASVGVNQERAPGSSLEDPRSKREERRAKQREQNLARAEAMHRARLAFEVEGRPPTEAGPPALNVGCSGWFYWHWRDSFYPPDSSPDTWFRHYADHFSTVELNAPFYSWPTVATVGSWLRQCDGKRFVYTVKVNELITHTRRFEATERLVRDFGLIADLLGPHMCVFHGIRPLIPATSDQLLHGHPTGRRWRSEARCSSLIATLLVKGVIGAEGCPREGPARPAPRPPRGWRCRARGRDLWATRGGIVRHSAVSVAVSRSPAAPVLRSDGPWRAMR